jgi:N-carbamoylputrescine amidase
LFHVLLVALPFSFACRNTYFNSIAVIDADGKNLGSYRKSHIPDSPGYHEKWHFSPGDTGFRVFDTAYARVGVAICWDQWFPEAARCMALGGAELLIYPTAIGSEPQDASLDSSGHWQRTMQGHAAANIVPVVAANRIGCETSPLSDRQISFYGTSFMADHTGLVVQQAGRNKPATLVHQFDLDAVAAYRRSWGVFRDRRPDLYGPIASLSGAGTAACRPAR